MGLLDSLTEITLIKIRLCLYCALFFFSLVTIGGTASMKGNADGCPLYVEVSGNYVTYYEGGCNYAFFVSIVDQMFYSIFRITTSVLFIIGRMPADAFLLSKYFQRMYVFFEMGSAFLVFVSACILSAGINSTCSVASKCKQMDWYSPSQAAQAGGWLSTLFYAATCVFGVLYLQHTDNMPYFSRTKKQEDVYTVSTGQTEGVHTVDLGLAPSGSIPSDMPSAPTDSEA